MAIFDSNNFQIIDATQSPPGQIIDAKYPSSHRNTVSRCTNGGVARESQISYFWAKCLIDIGTVHKGSFHIVFSKSKIDGGKIIAYGSKLVAPEPPFAGEHGPIQDDCEDE